MAYVVSNQGGKLLYPQEMSRIVVTVAQDGSAQPSTTITGSAGSVTLTAGNNAGFFPPDVIQLPGGAAGALEWYMIRSCGVPLGSDNATRMDLRPLKTLTTAVAAGSYSPYFRVPCKIMPCAVYLRNLATGEEHEWTRGMVNNTAIKRDAAGAATALANSGIVCTPLYIYFSPDMLSVSQTMQVVIDYAGG